MPASRPFVLPPFLLLAACGAEQNDLYPHVERGRNILYAAFTERPKHLDPARSYTEDEAVSRRSFDPRIPAREIRASCKRVSWKPYPRPFSQCAACLVDDVLCRARRLERVCAYPPYPPGEPWGPE
ncbi:MAG: hypothetical protein LBO79_07505 [Zoogloeaceae bacterium]|jgi:hypothetical protein|nr:hypothetical protein [Zoogloeaceae bacterium]